VSQFQIEGNPRDGYYWHLRADNGKLLGWTGEKHRDLDYTRKVVAWIRANAANIPVVDNTSR
jgi:uncharacterized protein YegP (UPF0339 family)